MITGKKKKNFENFKVLGLNEENTYKNPSQASSKPGILERYCLKMP